MKEVIRMTKKAMERAKVMEMIRTKKITQRKGAEKLGLSVRQVQRIYKKYLEKGDEGLNHGLVGRRGNNNKDEIKELALELYRKNYQGWGAVLAAEEIARETGATICPQTLYRWLREEGLWERRKKTPKHRLRRPRKASFGEMIQMDGSIHDWFGDGNKNCLTSMVDDATGKTFGLFATGETTELSLQCLYGWISRYGIPESIYTDRRSVYYTKRQKTIEEEFEGEEALTEFGRVCKELGIELIFANSPQAKGRIERSNGVHQDRLIKLLKHKGIKTIEEANRYLVEEYWDRHNAKYNKEPLSEEDHHVPLLEGQNLKDMVCFSVKRKISRDYVVKHKTRYFQLPRQKSIALKPGDRVTIKTWLDGSVHIYKESVELEYYEISSTGHKVPSTPPQKTTFLLR
ncbi:ISTde1, transposase [Brevinematales bacterium NS]|nr:ISTde1, transposase [Brevinematales bacterium NS]